MLIDSHCHLEFSDFKDDFDSILKKASDTGVEKMVTIGTKLSTFHKAIKIAGNHAQIFCSVGVHPSHVHEEGITTWEKITALCQHPKIIGIVTGKVNCCASCGSSFTILPIAANKAA